MFRVIGNVQVVWLMFRVVGNLFHITFPSNEKIKKI